MDSTTLHSFLGQHLVLKLIRQSRRTHDRDYKEEWQEFENFGEFYSAWKHLFCVPFSCPQRMAKSVLKLFLHRQLSAVCLREEQDKHTDETYWRLDQALAGALQASWAEVMEALEQCWPDEWADMQRKCGSASAVFAWSTP